MYLNMGSSVYLAMYFWKPAIKIYYYYYIINKRQLHSLHIGYITLFLACTPWSQIAETVGSKTLKRSSGYNAHYDYHNWSLSIIYKSPGSRPATQ